MQQRISEYVEIWKQRGYPDDIPDEVPLPLMRDNLAPSYKAICFAILKNDHAMLILGFTTPVSLWYGVLKRIEISQRPVQVGQQLCFPWGYRE